MLCMVLLPARFLCFNEIQTDAVSAAYHADDGTHGLLPTKHTPGVRIAHARRHRSPRFDSRGSASMKLVDFLLPSLVIPQLVGTTKQRILEEIAQQIAQALPETSASSVLQVLLERESLASTAIGEDLAIPHGKLEGVARLVGCVARAPHGVAFESLDGRPTHLFVALIAPESSTGMHLKALARISRIFKDAAFRGRLLRAADGAQMFAVIAEEDARF